MQVTGRHQGFWRDNSAVAAASLFTRFAVALVGEGSDRGFHGEAFCGFPPGPTWARGTRLTSDAC